MLSVTISYLPSGIAASFPVDSGLLIVGSAAVSSAVKQNRPLPSLSVLHHFIVFFLSLNLRLQHAFAIASTHDSDRHSGIK